MLEMIQKRLEDLKQKYEASQSNITKLTQQLENEKSISLQLVGHFNEATHLLGELQKSLEQGDVSNEQELHEGCSQASEQGEAA